MKFAHKQTGVNGGTQIVTVTEHNGKVRVKTKVIPTKMSKQLDVPFLVYLMEYSPEKYLKDAVSKLEKTK